MTKKLFVLLIFIASSLLSQSITWQSPSPTWDLPVKTIAVSPNGELYAGWAFKIMSLDSSNIWTDHSAGLPSSANSLSAVGFSNTSVFASFGLAKEFYRSIDKGRTWQQSSTGMLNPTVREIISSNDTVYGLAGSYVYRSTDDGKTWAGAVVGLPKAAYSHLLRLNNGTLLLTTSAGLYRSTDNAAHWIKVDYFASKSCRALGQDPDGRVLVVADTILYVSQDNGGNWTDSSVHLLNATKMVYADTCFFFLIDQDVYALAGDQLVLTTSGPEAKMIEDIAASPNGSLYAAHAAKGILIWNPAQKKWEDLHTGFKDAAIPVVAAELGRDYVALQGKGVYVSQDMGLGWNSYLSASKNPKAMFVSSPGAFVCDSAAIYRTTDAGTSWKVLNPLPGKGAFSIVNSGSRLFVGVEGSGVYCSTDNGDTWTARNTSIETRTVRSLVSLRDGVVLAAAEDGIYKTIDAGATWTRTEAAGAVTVLLRSAPGVLFAGAGDGVYRSMDDGATWKKLDSITGPVKSMVTLGVTSNVVASTSGGTYISYDLGVSWKKSGDDAFVSMVWNGSRIFASSFGEIKYGAAAFMIQRMTKWLPFGSLNQWYADIGCEPEEYRRQVQQDGWCYPAIRLNQDMQASKGFWIGYIDPSSFDQSRKNVIFAGPRGSDPNTFIPYKFSLTSMVEPPKVTVYNAEFPNRPVENEYVDPAQKSDLTLDNDVYTSSGIEIRRKIRQFSQQYHDNYIITEYTYLNSSATKLAGVYFYHLYRWAINADTRYVIGNSSGWGVNTMIDSRGDGLTPATTFFPGNKDNDIRAVYAWHGKFPTFTGGYDNIGGPIFVPYTGSGYAYQKGDTVGRLASSQFVGVAVLHADKAPGDTTDDMAQPATMSYEGSDDICMGTFPTGLHSSEMYALISKGRAAQRHADMIGPTGDPATGSAAGAGYSAALGFGPYTLQPGDSVHIVLVEAAAGIDEETALRVGRKFKYGQITAAQKNDTVYTGRDSLFQTFRRALANYHSGYMIPQPPVPPKTFSVNVVNNRVKLEWTTYAENDPKLTGFEIYRSAGAYYEKAEKVASFGAGQRTWTDSTCRVGEKYFYYIISIGRSSDNTGIGMTPAGSLQSSRYYTQTYDPVSTLTPVKPDETLPDQFALEQNYPNPFNPSTSISFSLPSKAHVTVNVFDALGRMVSTVVSETLPAGRYTRAWNASGFPSGMYFYRIQAGAFTQTKRLVILK